MTEHRPKEPVKKMNSVSKFERMQQMQREEEEKRLEELRYSSFVLLTLKQNQGGEGTQRTVGNDRSERKRASRRN